MDSEDLPPILVAPHKSLKTRARAIQPADMDGVVLFAANPEEACAKIDEVFRQDTLESQFRRAGPAYVERFDWDRIAQSYATLYDQAKRSTAGAGSA